MTVPTPASHSAEAPHGGPAATQAESTTSAESRPVVRLSTGAVRGVRESSIDRFLGIPYAAPPFGSRRYAPPQPPASWEGERDASAFGPTSPQSPYVGGLEKYLPTVDIQGDDILTLNVWTPADRGDDAALPVVVFVHGGALSRGSAALAAYDGTTFARHGIVYVSIQYRLGQEGFAVLDDVPYDLGVLDQQAALRWVRREVAAFGGDPARVTAMGHSAGALTLTALLTLPHARDLFDRVILQSGPMKGQPPRKATRMSKLVAKRVRVKATRAGFSSVAPALLVAAQTESAAGGVPLGGPNVPLAIGGEAVPVDPLTALVSGAGRGIPVLIGSTSEEYRLWFVPSGVLTRVKRATLEVARASARVPRRIVAAHRRRRPEALPGEILGEILSDMLIRGPHTRFADSRIGGAAPTYVYEFRWQSPVDGLGAAHGMELGFVFDRIDTPDAVAMGGPDGPQHLAAEMHAAWVAFIVDGDPGWEPWSARRPVRVFDGAAGGIDHAPRADELRGLPAR